MFVVFKEKPKLTAILSLSAGLIIFVLISIISNFYFKSFNASNLKAERYYQAIKCLDDINFNLSNVEGNERGFILSGSEKFIANIEAQDAIIDFNLERIAHLLDDQADLAIFSKQKAVIREKQKYVLDIIVIYRTQGMNSASNQFKTLQGFELMNSVVAIGMTLQNSLSKKIAMQYTEARRFETNIKVWDIFAIIIVALIISMSIRSIFNELDKRHAMNVELQMARDKADATREFKQQFLANMSHEVRTPVHTISGFADLLIQTPLETNQKEFINSIQQSSRNLLAIVNDVLDYSKIDAGMLHISKTAFSLVALINTITKSFSEQIRQGQNTFNLDIDPALPKSVLGDPGRLSQILVNLIGNAVKFTKGGMITLTVKQFVLANNQVQINFAVIDSGIGISAKKLVTIFERFQQADATTSNIYGGTGLGLPIVKQLVELQGGHISVYSIPNIGSEFSFDLTYEIANDELEIKAVTANPDPARLQFKAKVLLAEDNELNQKLANAILENMGFEVSLACDGQQAIDMLGQDKFDLALLDIQMPKRSGYEVSQYIRNELHLNIPIIAITSGNMVEEQLKTKAVGMNACLSKPLDLSTLSLILKDHLKSSLEVDAGESLILKTSDRGLVDLKYLYDNAKANHSFVLELIATFKTYNQKDLNVLEQAIAAKDSKQIKYLAHKMHSALQYMSVQVETEAMVRHIENFELSTSNHDVLVNDFKQFKKRMEEIYRYLDKIDLAYLEAQTI